jgi:hypothetical protein
MIFGFSLIFQTFRKRVFGNCETVALSDLLRKGKSFEWNDPHQMAFAKLKEILMNSPVLCVYNPKTRTEIHTDASSIGLGAVLIQKQSDGELKPISYYSRILPVGNTFYYSYRL